MATIPDRNLDFEEQRVRILRAIEEVEKLSAESRKLSAEQLKLPAEQLKIEAETGYLPRTVNFQAMIATAALLGAGAALAKFFLP